MFTMRIRTPADAVAGAVMLLQVIPEDSLCLIFAGTPMALRCDVPSSADDVEAFAMRMRMLAATYDLSMPVAVVFGTAPQARESLRTLAVVRDVFTVQMLVQTDTVTCQEYRQEAAGEFSAGDSTPVDLYTHPFTAEGVMQGFCSLQTEARLRLDYTPAGTDAAELTASPRWAAYAGSGVSVPEIADTLAEHVSALPVTGGSLPAHQRAGVRTRRRGARPSHPGPAVAANHPRHGPGLSRTVAAGGGALPPSPGRGTVGPRRFRSGVAAPDSGRTGRSVRSGAHPDPVGRRVAGHRNAPQHLGTTARGRGERNGREPLSG